MMKEKDKLCEEIMKGIEDEVRMVVEMGIKKAKEKKLRLADMEVIVRDEMRKAEGKILGKVMELGGTGYEGTQRKCACGERQVFVSNRSKQVTTLSGMIFVK